MELQQLVAFMRFILSSFTIKTMYTLRILCCLLFLTVSDHIILLTFSLPNDPNSYSFSVIRLCPMFPCYRTLFPISTHIFLSYSCHLWIRLSCLLGGCIQFISAFSSCNNISSDLLFSSNSDLYILYLLSTSCFPVHLVVASFTFINYVCFPAHFSRRCVVQICPFLR